MTARHPIPDAALSQHIIVLGKTRSGKSSTMRGLIEGLLDPGKPVCIIDLGGWTVADRTRFFIDFASALFRHPRGPRWLCIDEVHDVAPQGNVYVNSSSGR